MRMCSLSCGHPAHPSRGSSIPPYPPLPLLLQQERAGILKTEVPLEIIKAIQEQS